MQSRGRGAGGGPMTPRNLKPAVWLPAIRANTGADVFTNRLCDGLNSRGIRAEIAWLPHRAEYLPWSVPIPTMPDWANVVHVNSWLPKRFWPCGLPIVVTVHHLVHDPAYHAFRSMAQTAYHEALIRRRELAAILDADAVTTVSSYVKGTIVEFSGRRDIAVIHNWVNGDVFSPDERKHEPYSGAFRLLMVGSKSQRKGYDLLPALVDALGPGFEVRYAGGSPAGATDVPSVLALGRISDEELIREYRQCDAVLSLSRYEGFGYTALEGMACGKPILAFHTSALPEVIVDGATGLLATKNDVTAMAAHCRKLAGNRVLTERMGQAGRRRAIEQFPEAEAVDAYVQTYAGLVGHIGKTSQCARD